MSDKLTIQEAARYLGQKLALYDLEGNFIRTPLATCEFLSDFNYLKKTLSVKIILRSIEDMTEEEESHYNSLITELQGFDYAEDEILYFAKITNYLRSIGVDCDDLIKQGKAIRKQ